MPGDSANSSASSATCSFRPCRAQRTSSTSAAPPATAKIAAVHTERPTQVAIAKTTTDATESRTSRRMTVDVTPTEATRAATPRMSVTFKMFEPTILPTAIPISPRAAAKPDTRNSGALVPRPITTTPTTTGAIRSRPAIRDDPSTRWSAATVSSTRPTTTSSDSNSTVYPQPDADADQTSRHTDAHASRSTPPR